MNKEEALRCLEISKRKFKETGGSIETSLKFVKKSLALHETKEAQDWFLFLKNSKQSEEGQQQEDKKYNDNDYNTRKEHSNEAFSSSSSGPRLRKKQPSTSTTASSPSSANTKDSSSSKNNDNNKESKNSKARPYTDHQVQGVRKIKQFKSKGDLYGILELEKSCTDSEIKKAYRRLALQYHPDKCSAPGTDDAFKAIGHSFAVLSDKDKRDQYDRFGIDSESRATSGGGRPGNGMPRNYGFEQFEGELSPEDIFNMFFGQMAAAGGGMGGMGSPFGPGVSFRAFGPGGRATFHSNQRFRQYQQQQQSGLSAFTFKLLQLLPLLLLLISPVINNFLQYLFSETPTFSLYQSNYYYQLKSTMSHQVPYYINPELDSRKGYNDPLKRRKIEREVEQHYLYLLRERCTQERDFQRQKIREAYGWISVDQQKLKAAQDMRLDSCERLRRF